MSHNPYAPPKSDVDSPTVGTNASGVPLPVDQMYSPNQIAAGAFLVRRWRIIATLIAVGIARRGWHDAFVVARGRYRAVVRIDPGCRRFWNPDVAARMIETHGFEKGRLQA
jgi:hypothetical protein